MKKQNELQLSSIYDIFSNYTTELDSQVKEQIKILQQEYNNNIIEAQINLLMEICEDNNFNFNDFKEKYIKKKNCSNNKFIKIDEEVLNRIIIEDNTFYYENKENGNVYNSSSKIVGTVHNNKIILNEHILKEPILNEPILNDLI